MERLVPLDDARARDPEIAGHKAAELARATAAEMPVLPGWVLPLGESAAALAIGSAAGREASSATSVLAVSSIELDDELRCELASVVASLGGSVVVRSSSPLEADPRWSGAFATYLDVGTDDIEAAVRGCWASVFGRDALARGERLLVDPADRGVAVLIQPWVAFAGGGVAVIELDGRIRISATRGAPADLVSGRDAGMTIHLDVEDRPEDDALPEGIQADIVGTVCRLMREVRESLSGDIIEWGSASGAVTLLQARRATPTSVAAARASGSHGRRYPPVAARLALAAASCPGPLGERWVLPWALALERLPRPARVDVGEVGQAIAEAGRLSSELAASTWQLPSDRVDAETRTSFRAVLGPEPFDELNRLATLRPPDLGRAARLLGLLSGIGGALHAAGSLPAAEHVWWLSPHDLDRVAEGRVAPARTGHDRWEPFVFSVAEDRGRPFVGRSASSGIGAGPAFALGSSSWIVPPPRRVLVVSSVVPQLASLLWGAAGLVARTGSEGAHLFEVARSLGLPAVIGVDVDAADPGVVAVNGDDGTVSVLRAEPRDQRVKENTVFSPERRTG
ncbi:MAG: PEP/pyruvate-binding domain-containing protein [Actinomycetota bacterium]